MIVEDPFLIKLVNAVGTAAKFTAWNLILCNCKEAMNGERQRTVAGRSGR